MLAHFAFHCFLVAACFPPVYEYRLSERQAMIRKITGYEKDDEGHWKAVLDCGHHQHLRHNPPLISRPWVLSEAGRNSRIGSELNCKQCDEEAMDKS